MIGAEDGAPPREPSAHEHKEPQATPLVRRIAQELGVELASVAGTGAGGRITEEDVRAAAAGAIPAEGRREPLRGVRRLIADHLARSHREVPAVTFVEECDFTGVDLARLVPLVLRATALSLREFPELNARLEGDEIVYLERYDLGLAVQTEQGLVVPVVRGCDTASLEELDAEVQRLAEAARAGDAPARRSSAARPSPSRAPASSAGSSSRRSSTTPRSGSSASTGSARGPSPATARSSSGRSATSRSPSTTASWTARARPRSAST